MCKEWLKTKAIGKNEREARNAVPCVSIKRNSEQLLRKRAADCHCSDKLEKRMANARSLLFPANALFWGPGNVDGVVASRNSTRRRRANGEAQLFCDFIAMSVG